MSADHVGILPFVSLRERTAALVADSGVALAVASDAWFAVSDKVRGCVESGGRARDLALKVDALGELLARYLPRDQADINELPDEVLR